MEDFNSAKPAKDPPYPSRSGCKITSDARTREYNAHFDRAKLVINRYLERAMAISDEEQREALFPLMDFVIHQLVDEKPNKSSVGAFAEHLGMIVAKLAVSAPSGRERYDVFVDAGMEVATRVLNNDELTEDLEGDEIERTPAMFQRELTAFVAGLTSTCIARGLITPEAAQRSVSEGLKSGLDVGNEVHMRRVRREIAR